MFPFSDKGIFARNWGWFCNTPLPRLIFCMGMAPCRRLGIVIMFPAAPPLLDVVMICWPLGEDTIWNCCPCPPTAESCWACANCRAWPSAVWNWGITWYWMLGITPDMVVSNCWPCIDGAWASTYCCGCCCCCPWVHTAATDGDSTCLLLQSVITTWVSVTVLVPEDVCTLRGTTCQPLALEVKTPWLRSSCCCWFCCWWSVAESFSPGVSIRLHVAANKASGDGCWES